MVSVKKKWLTKVGGIPVEKCRRDGGSLPDVKRLFSPASVFVPAKGVQHTTEGHFGPSLSRFVNDTGTPTFMLGYNELKVVNGKLTNKPASNGEKIRVAQFMPIGEACLTLQNAAGGTETNREAHVQIELVGTCVVGASGVSPWLPEPPVLKVLADLYSQLDEAVGIPLQRGGNGTRSLSRWDERAGWFGHGEAPENDHTDPRQLQWDKLFAAAAPTEEFWEARAGGELVHRERVKPNSEGVPGLDRLLTWMDRHKGDVRKAEEKHGGVRLVRVARRV